MRSVTSGFWRSLTTRGTHLDVGSVSSSISERHEHNSRNVDDLTVDFENTSSGLHLRLESMRGSTEPVETRWAVSFDREGDTD